MKKLTRRSFLKLLGGLGLISTGAIAGLNFKIKQSAPSKPQKTEGCYIPSVASHWILMDNKSTGKEVIYLEFANKETLAQHIASLEGYLREDWAGRSVSYVFRYDHHKVLT